MAEKRDYYEVLGVSKNATEQEIKSAYRKKAKELHPDVNKDDLHAEEKFKALQEAYSVLSNEEKRRKYDKEYQKYHHSAPTSQKTNREDTNENDDWYEIMLNCQETADQIITMKKTIISLKKEKAIDSDTYFQAIFMWRQIADNYLIKLVKASKKACSLHFDTTEIDNVKAQIIIEMWTTHENTTPENMEKTYIF